MRLLLIEDDPQFVRHVEIVANSLNVEFVACMTGKEGLRRVSKGDVDVVIVDGVLPDKQGPRIIEDIRSMRPRIAPKIVFLSAFFNDVRTFRKLTALGVDLVLSKPITATDLKKKLAEFMPDKPTGDAEQDTAADLFKAAFERLKEDYIEKLRQFWAPKFDNLVERAAIDDLGAIDEIRHVCHKLRGTAGSYGQEHISQAAARLENGVNNQELARLVPEMRAFARMLKMAGQVKPNAYSGVHGVTKFRTVIVVTEAPFIYTRVAKELAEDNLQLERASSVYEALQKAVAVWPDLFIIDAAAMDDDLEVSVITSLYRRHIGVPILAFGTPDEELPLHAVSVPPTVRRSELLAAFEQPGLQPFSDCSLLLCDEHKNVAETVQNVCGPLGIEVSTITSPDEYEGLVHKQHPPLVLMDVAFGSRTESEVNGIELVRKAAENKNYSPAPVIFLSGQTSLSERDDVYDLGVGYVLKPLSEKQLFAEVTRVLRRRRFTRFARVHLTRDTRPYREFDAGPRSTQDFEELFRTLGTIPGIHG